MATSKGYFVTPNFRFLDAHAPLTPDSMFDFELEESDVWTTARSASPEFRKTAPNSSLSRKFSSEKFERVGSGGVCATAALSLPMNVPDWSKILKDEYRDDRRRCGENFDFHDEEEEDGGDRIPPHEFLARTRMASFSVHEGVGRTLKGRDLSRVRNEIFQKTGFED